MTELGGNVRELSSSYLKKRLRRFDADLCPKKAHLDRVGDERKKV